MLVDAGDMFQGTLESNLGEGAAVVRAYNALGYDAAALGNHEFDFGPVGPAPAPRTPADDARGALKARAAEAKFPLLVANIADAASGEPPRLAERAADHDRRGRRRQGRHHRRDHDGDAAHDDAGELRRADGQAAGRDRDRERPSSCAAPARPW